MKLIFLGTGGSWPSKERNVASIALKIGREILLFDCGEGTQRQFMRSTLSFMQITKVFITHFHGDHFLGLPGLIQSMYLNRRKRELEIFGPEGTIHVIKTLLTLGYFNPTFDVIVHDLKDRDVIKFRDYDIKVRSVEHGIPALAYALEEHDKPGRFNLERAKELKIPEGHLYRKLQSGKSIELNGRTITPDMVLGEPRKGRKIVYSGDTVPCKAIIELAENCDVLIFDSTTDSSLQDKANEYGHSTARQAAEVAKQANARLLFLTHISPRYKESKSIKEDARAVFENAIVAEDFMEYDVRLR